MRLFEAIVEANHRAIAGDKEAGLHPGEFAEELPLVALTCVDPRLNRLFPDVLGLPGDQFIWLRNAGNIITGKTSSTMRSLSLACAVKGGREIAIIGHTDCQVGRTTTVQILERLQALGVQRNLLPENLNEFFGMFGSEQQNVVKACEFVRSSPLIGPKIPVHGLLVDIESGKLDWVVNGYQNWESVTSKWNEAVQSAEDALASFKELGNFQIGEMKLPETKIGEGISAAGDWLSQKLEKLEIKHGDLPEITPGMQHAANVAEKMIEIAQTHWAPESTPAPPPHPAAPVTPPKPPPLPRPKIPLPPPIRPKLHIRK